jgi:hypothetical protein
MNRKTNTYGSGVWSHQTSRSSSEKTALARLPMKKNQSDQVPMKASDPALERIYRKVISGECYDHTYYRISESELSRASLVVYITHNNVTLKSPRYLYNIEAPVVTWKFSKVSHDTDQKYTLLEKLIRKMLRSS